MVCQFGCVAAEGCLKVSGSLTPNDTKERSRRGNISAGVLTWCHTEVEDAFG